MRRTGILNRDEKNFEFFVRSLFKYAPMSYSKEDETLKNCLPRIRAARAARGCGEQRRCAAGEIPFERVQRREHAVAAASLKIRIDDATIEKHSSISWRAGGWSSFARTATQLLWIMRTRGFA